MKYLILLIVFFLQINLASGQRYDYNWIGGTSIGDGGGVAFFMRFDDKGIIAIDSIQTRISPRFGQITISDNDGDLLFYTNGNFIADRTHQVMEDGWLNEGSPWRSSVGAYGPYCNYCYQVVPDGYASGVFYLVHPLMVVSSEPNFKGAGSRVMLTKIDMNAKAGLGVVVYKDRSILNKEVSPVLKTVLHGNGSDWWVLARSIDGRYYHTILLRGDSVVQNKIQFNVDTEPYLNAILDSIATSQFSFDVSPSGEYILENIGQTHHRLLHFDRCTGEMQLVNEFDVPVDVFPYNPPRQNARQFYLPLFAISDNDQYAYAWGVGGLYQWDLFASDIASTKTKIFGPPRYIEFNDIEYPNHFYWLISYTFGPDGKLYFLTKYNHYVIHRPNEKGAACMVEGPRALPERIYMDSPNYPNYRLGPLKGSGCDTLISGRDDIWTDSKISLYPNPSPGQVTIEWDLPSWGSSEFSIIIHNVIGSKVYESEVGRWAYRHKIEPGILTPGTYFVSLEVSGALVHTQRLVVHY